MPEPRFPYEKDLPEFDRVVAGAQRELMLHVRHAIQSGDLRSRRTQLLQLARVTAVLDQLGAFVDPAARRMVEDAYRQGAGRALQQIGALGIGSDTGAFGGTAAEAVGVLQESVVSSLRDGRARVGRQVQDVYARAGRQAATRALLGAEGSPRAAARALVRDLMQDRQIARMVRETGAGFVDAGGRKWTIERYAQMVVRTTTREAVVQGAVDRMASHGVSLARVSMHASACEICRPFEGKLIDLSGQGGTFDGETTISGPFPPYHPNAVMAGTTVESVGLVSGAVRARWNGPLVHLTTAGGIDLAIGPNHPVLTARGWLAAKLLRKGDHVLRRSPKQRVSATAGPAIALERSLGPHDHFDEIPPLVEDIFDALASATLPTSIPASPAHLHGDGNFCQGKVDVVRADGPLGRGLPSEVRQPLRESVLVGADPNPAGFASFSAPCEHLRWVRLPIGGALADLEASGPETPQQGLATDWKTYRQMLSGCSLAVEVDEIIEIRNVVRHVGWAFDLETESATYFADSLFVHNCTHNLSPVAVRVERLRREMAA